MLLVVKYGGLVLIGISKTLLEIAMDVYKRTAGLPRLCCTRGDWPNDLGSAYILILRDLLRNPCF